MLTVNGKRESEFFAFLLQFINTGHVITQVNKSQISPIAVLINSDRIPVRYLYQLDLRGTKQPGKEPFPVMFMPQQNTADRVLTPGQAGQVIPNLRLIIYKLVITENVGVNFFGLLNIGNTNHRTIGGPGLFPPVELEPGVGFHDLENVVERIFHEELFPSRRIFGNTIQGQSHLMKMIVGALHIWRFHLC